jgi:2-methylisocitrate lyase-like PEP mutase family enzyme
VNAVDLPVNADFESGYSDSPDGVAVNVRRCVATGVAGLSIEDATGDRARPLYELPVAVERIKGARAAIDESGTGVQLTARAECFLVGHDDPLKESIRRLNAYAAAGADVLFAPGIHQRDDIRTLAAALKPKPVNVLVSRNIGLTVADLAGLGVRRVSLGSVLARAAWTRFMEVAKDVASEARFTSLDGIGAFADLNDFFRDDFENR